MRKTRSQKFLSLILLLVLTAALALTVVGCDDSKNEDGAVTTTAAATTEAATYVGEGSTEFVFQVVTRSGEEKVFNVRTDKTVVGEALLDAGLIAGEDSQYGLYVKTVDGETLDYVTDGKYWAFYVDGAYALSGVDSTTIEEGKVYCFKAE